MTLPPPLELLDRLPDAVLVLDVDGCVLACNDRARRLLGIEGEVRGQPVTAHLEIRDTAGRACPLPPPAPLVGDRLAERVVTVATPRGSRPVALSGRWVDGAWTLVLRSAGRRLAVERRQGDVVATVSHEVRSPLASVKGFTRTLLKRWDRFSDAQKLAMLETIDADADRVTRLLLDLLDVSRIDAGRVELHRRPVDLVALVRCALDRARRRDDARGRALVLEVAGDLPVLHADGDRVEQVLVNMIDNALQHGQVGTVTVRLTPAAGGARRADGADGADGVRLEVADEGPGVPDELRHVVFEKFGRGRDRRRAGTGLGLYITRGLVEAHGGTIELVGSGPGARFVVWLPT